MKFSPLFVAIVFGSLFSLGVFSSLGEEPRIDAEFPGGNVVVESISETEVRLRPDLRDTEGDWFFTAFRVRGAQGKTLKFVYDKDDRIGPRGPAVSSDGGATWRWLSETPDANSREFAYAFGEEEREVLFALSPLYTRANWDAFVASRSDVEGFEPFVLCSTSDVGADEEYDPSEAFSRARTGKAIEVPALKIASSSEKPTFGVALTARHHCCEAVASFVLEGLIDGILAEDETGAFLRKNCEFFVVPLVDAAGVEAGDQGKNRKPHDHNRDYAMKIHPSIKALTSYIEKNFADKKVAFADWHCPWIRGGRYNEAVYFPETAHKEMTAKLRRYSEYLEEAQQGKGLPYRASNNLSFGTSWNTVENYVRQEDGGETLSSKHWAETLPNIYFSFGCEIPYANAEGAVVSPESAREFGRSAAKALADVLREDESSAPAREEFGGIIPRLGYFNDEGECGTGAVVAWADRLWFTTYGPHSPNGSSDKLYELDSDLNLTIRPESVGGTNANRMVHRESNQLFIGNHAIDADRNVRTIPHKDMPGRNTAVTRHLYDPENKVYFLTMEEGLYEVDVRTLEVREICRDGNSPREKGEDALPGYHGKGAFASQGRVVYANNGEDSVEARVEPTTPSGCLAEWLGEEKGWSVVRRNQFTEVVGPDGIYGGTGEDVVWSLGWDAKSLILEVLEDGKWSAFRLPKASHCYDGAHGWNTEWPRIRKIDDAENYLATMHGTFWRFPREFRASAARGIRPRSTYLKVIADWEYWNGKVAFGCDDSAKNEFLNKSPLKPGLGGPGRSNSNLWFVEPSRLDSFGPTLGRGAVWLDEDVASGAASDPYLFAGYDNRGAFYSFDSADADSVELTFEADARGDGNWREFAKIDASKKFGFVEFEEPSESFEWTRVKASANLKGATVFFQYGKKDERSVEPDAKFAGLARADESRDYLGARLWARADNGRLAVVSQVVSDGEVREERYYELTESGALERVPCVFEGGEEGTISRVKETVEPKPIDPNVYRVDELGVLIQLNGKRYRLPIGSEEALRASSPVVCRLDREVCTERDLFHCAGTFYELPAENAGGFAKIRPIATSDALVSDYASFRGALVLSGVSRDASRDSDRIVRSADGLCGLWLGSVDELWELGRPRGRGYLWRARETRDGDASDPMLTTGFRARRVVLENESSEPVEVALELDPTGDERWSEYRRVKVPGQGRSVVEIADGAPGYWARVVAKGFGKLTATLECGLD